MEENSAKLSRDGGDLPRNDSGVIYSFTIVRVGFGHMADKTPYALLMVELDEEKGMELGALFTKDIDEVAIGKTVKHVETNPEIGIIFSLES